MLTSYLHKVAVIIRNSGSSDLEVLWTEEAHNVPASFCCIFRVYRDKTARILKGNALEAYPLHDMFIIITKIPEGSWLIVDIKLLDSSLLGLTRETPGSWNSRLRRSIRPFRPFIAHRTISFILTTLLNSFWEKPYGTHVAPSLSEDFWASWRGM